MKGNIEDRACMMALYIIENRATVRACARKFGISKSTVHTAVTKWNGFGRGTRRAFPGQGASAGPDAKKGLKPSGFRPFFSTFFAA